jgi:hypothetical protein
VPERICKEISLFAAIANAMTLPIVPDFGKHGIFSLKEFSALFHRVFRHVLGSSTYCRELQSFAQKRSTSGNQMAKIYFMREGLTGRVDPVAEKPLGWCIEKLGLQMRDWWADLETKFTIDNWKSGYYFSPAH